MCYCFDDVVAMLSCQNNVVILGFISTCVWFHVECKEAYLTNGEFSSVSIQIIFSDSMKKFLLISNSKFSPLVIT